MTIDIKSIIGILIILVLIIGWLISTYFIFDSDLPRSAKGPIAGGLGVVCAIAATVTIIKLINKL